MSAPEPAQAPLAPAPEGYRYVYNRMNWEYEQAFDGKPLVFRPHEVRMLTTPQAEHLRAYSLIPGTLARGRGHGGDLASERAIALGPGYRIEGIVKTGEPTASGADGYTIVYEQADPEPLFLVPCETKVGLMYFDQTSLSNYSDRPSADGRPTHAELIRV